MVSQQELKSIFPSFEDSLIDELANASDCKTFKDGTLLMKTGQYIRSTMIVLDGLVKVFREDEEGNEYFMYFIEPGQACALSMVCSSTQDTSELTAVAVGDIEVLTVPLSKMDELMAKYTDWYQFVLRTYRKRFEELLVTIDHIAFRNMDERLVFYLKKTQKGLKSNIIPLTHAEIANELNSSREVITRLMKKLAEKGAVKLNRNSVEIIDATLLDVT
ncbi:Crp/Fnr family transcriptional regulator [Polluticoccus soli]|uniref:Crp/Fnr family transcriptional regulator n=1 Tax=Polluticoccus soli TaxID=3034150 RepID=UPI0023E34DF7|nr:Crp/Fnr family transcriptional regulator [Flavipsychrobacter sp. JY13-12]